MPGLCGVIELAPGGEAAESRHILSGMVKRLCLDERYRIMDRLDLGPFHVTAVGYPSFCYQAHSSSGEEWTEVWFGELHHPRVTTLEPSALAGAPTGAVAGSAPPRATAALHSVFRLVPDGIALEDGLRGLSGSFMGLRIDASRTRFELFTDHLASFPLFIRRAGRFLLFAPEVKALLEPSPSELELDTEAFAFFLMAGYLPPDRTFFRQIRPPGSAAIFSGRTGAGAPEARARRYWRFVFPDRPERRPARELQSALAAVLREAAAAHALPDERIAILLSGGLDSRAILGAVHAEGRRLLAVTWGYGPARPDGDLAVAKTVAARFDVPHRVFALRPWLLPDTAAEWVWRSDGSSDGLYLYPEGDAIFRQLAEAADVALRGDECFGMKWPYGIPDEITALRCVEIFPLPWHGLYRRILRPGAWSALAERAGGALSTIRRTVPPADPADWKDEYYFGIRHQGWLNRLNYYKMQTIPTRNPLLDRRILDFVLGIPAGQRRSKRLFKAAAREILFPFPLADVPFATRNSLIPWARVAPADERLRTFFGDHLRSLARLFPEVFVGGALEQQIDDWLARAPVGELAHDGAIESARPSLRSRLGTVAKHVAYHRNVPGAVRRRLIRTGSNRPSFHYAFRLLSLSLYFRRLEELGIRCGIR